MTLIFIRGSAARTSSARVLVASTAFSVMRCGGDTSNGSGGGAGGADAAHPPHDADAKIDPAAYCAAFCKSALGNGCEVFDTVQNCGEICAYWDVCDDWTALVECIGDPPDVSCSDGRPDECWPVVEDLLECTTAQLKDAGNAADASLVDGGECSDGSKKSCTCQQGLGTRVCYQGKWGPCGCSISGDF